MKKGFIMTLALSLSLACTAAGLAAPVEFTGDFRLQGRSLDDNITHPESWANKDSFFQFRARLNFTGRMDKNTAFFARFSARNDFGGASASDTGLDHYGVKLTSGSWKFSVGRQAVTLGKGTIIDTGYDAAGTTPLFDGVVAATRVGKVDIRIVGGKITADGYPRMLAGTPPDCRWASNEFYGIDFSAKVADNLTIGATLAQEKVDSSGYVPAAMTPDGVAPVRPADGTAWPARAVRSWAVNLQYDLSPNLAFNAEYTKSNKKALAFGDNKAYFLAATYSWDKDSFTVQYNRVGDFAVDPFASGLGAAAYPLGGIGLYTPALAFANSRYSGFTYSYNHEISKMLSFHAVYMSLKKESPFIAAAGGDNEFAAGLVWKF